MNHLKESLEKYQQTTYKKTKRDSDTYESVKKFCTDNIKVFLNEYQLVTNKQYLREIRNCIDYHLRRYHQYCIKEKIGAHYIEIGADQTDFEHLIPSSRIRDLLLNNIITIEQGLNAPTVKLSKKNHKLLQSKGLGNSTPDMYYPFRRYTSTFKSKFMTHDGNIIENLDEWTLLDHYNYFEEKK